jgi:hypothetical protein
MESTKVGQEVSRAGDSLWLLGRRQHPLLPGLSRRDEGMTFVMGRELTSGTTSQGRILLN